MTWWGLGRLPDRKRPGDSSLSLSINRSRSRLLAYAHSSPSASSPYRVPTYINALTLVGRINDPLPLPIKPKVSSSSSSLAPYILGFLALAFLVHRLII
nr:hypothetical protein Q903MT_gene3095 [Picea sitchensis]